MDADKEAIDTPSTTEKDEEAEIAGQDRTRPKTSQEAVNSNNDAKVPDGGYGWVCVACSMMINAHTWGTVASYGVVLAYYLSHDYFPGTTPTTYAFIGTLYLSQGLLISPVATYLVRRFGTHTCLLTGVVLQTAGLLSASFAKQGYQVVLAQGFCSGWGVGFLFVGSVGIQSQWFDKRRGFANAIVAAGTGFGAIIYSLAVQRMIDTIGLHWSYRVLAIVTCVVNTTASLLLRDRNKAVGARHRPFSPSLMKRPEFICLQLWSFCTVLAYSAVAFSVAPQAVSIGLTHQQGSILTAVYNVGQAVGRPTSKQTNGQDPTHV